jgi:hypothetical protein
MRILVLLLILLTTVTAYAAPKKVAQKPLDLSVNPSADNVVILEPTNVPQLDFGFDKPTPIEEEKVKLSPEFHYLDSEDPTRRYSEDREKEFKMKLKMGF